MTGDFGKFINEKRLGRGPAGEDILLKDITTAMGTTATYLSDIIKGRRNPPEMNLLLKIAEVLQLTDEEKAEMFDLAGRERNEAAPDLDIMELIRKQDQEGFMPCIVYHKSISLKNPSLTVGFGLLTIPCGIRGKIVGNPTVFCRKSYITNNHFYIHSASFSKT